MSEPTFRSPRNDLPDLEELLQCEFEHVISFDTQSTTDRMCVFDDYIWVISHHGQLFKWSASGDFSLQCAIALPDEVEDVVSFHPTHRGNLMVVAEWALYVITQTADLLYWIQNVIGADVHIHDNLVALSAVSVDAFHDIGEPPRPEISGTQYLHLTNWQQPHNVVKLSYGGVSLHAADRNTIYMPCWSEYEVQVYSRNGELVDRHGWHNPEDEATYEAAMDSDGSQRQRPRQTQSRRHRQEYSGIMMRPRVCGSDSSGRVLVVDPGYSTIQVLSSMGEWSEFKQFRRQLLKPTDIFIMGEMLYILHKGRHNTNGNKFISIYKVKH